MNVQLDSESKKWIESKGSQLTVKVMDVKACCAPDVQEVVAVPGKPKTLDRFKEFKVDNISIFVQKTICGKEQLSLKLSGISFLKSISAKVH